MMKIYLIAKTQLMQGMDRYLDDIKQRDWVDTEAAQTDILVEFAGRMCYKSWAPYDGTENTNANVKKIRVGNDKYIRNILKQGHGSVLEHINFTFLCTGVSRVFTHELVRHRAGCAYSQESLRYCRLEHMEVVLPEIENPDGLKLAKEVVEELKSKIKELNDMLIWDTMPMPEKKALTSWIRRICPIGISTNILFTANVRALRHIIAMRTSIHAEVEIRQAFWTIAQFCKEGSPSLFQDMILDNQSGTVEFEYDKV